MTHLKGSALFPRCVEIRVALHSVEEVWGVEPIMVRVREWEACVSR